MACLDCTLHGKRVHLLEKSTDKEYVFITPRFQVFPDDCADCVDPDCPHDFNTKKLLKNKALRACILNHVFDASFDDYLLEHGLIPARSLALREMNQGEEVCSKPSFSEKEGLRLLKLDQKAMKKRDIYFKALDEYRDALMKMQPAPKRVIIKRKE